MYVLRDKDRLTDLRSYFQDGWGWDVPLSDATLYKEPFESDGVFLKVNEASAYDGQVEDFERKLRAILATK